MPVVGFLHSGFSASFDANVKVFLRSLNEGGYVAGKNVLVEYRWAEDRADKLPVLANELVRLRVAVLVASTSAASLAAKAATTAIPVVFETGGDPIKMGLVTSFNRPDGNATGVTQFTGALEPKRLELLREVVPTASVIGALVNPARPGVETQINDLQEAARALGLQIVFLNARNENDFDSAFETFVQRGVKALIVGSDPFFHSRREQIVALAARHAMPAIYQWRDHAAVGGLMSYGTSLAETYRQMGIYTARILKGEKIADLPVVRSNKVELVINLKTAKTLGLTLPVTLLGRADEVIE